MAKNFLTTLRQVEKIKGECMSFAALRAVILIKERVQNKGQGSSGSALPKYSDKYTIEKGSRGGRVDITNLTDTGQMMNDLKPTSQSADGNQVTVGFSIPALQKRADNVTARKGLWIKPTKKELIQISNTFTKCLRRVLGKNTTTIKKL